MKTHLQPRTCRSGFTYVSVVITMIVVGTMLTAYLKMVSVQNQSTMRSQAWNRTVPVLEAGVEEALAHLNKNAASDAAGVFTVNMTADGWTETGTGGWYKIGELGDDVYHTVISPFSAGTYYPLIKSVGYVKQLPTLSMKSKSGLFVAAISLQELQATRSGYVQRTVFCNTTNVPAYTKALVAKHGIDLRGNNIRTDSFDSTIPAYNTDTKYDPTKARDHGDIASNDTITNSISVGNANVYGNVATGPRGTVSVGPLGCVGDAAFQANPANAGKIQPGHSTDDMNVEFTDQIMPSVAWSALPSGGTVNGENYTHVFDQPGDYQATLALNGNLLISAPNVRIRVDGGMTFTGTEGLHITSNANVIVYLNCPSASIGGLGIMNEGRANQCYILGTEQLTSLSIGGNGSITAVVNAPYADVTFDGSGHVITDFSGAAMANSFQFTGNFNFHFDESLPRIGFYRGYAITSWNEK